MRKHRLWKLVVAMLPMMLLSFSVFAQKHQVSGKIVDEEQMPVPGVNVVIKGTTVGTITGGDGTFSMQAADNDVLVITYIGYNTEEITVKGAGPYNVALMPDVVGLDEVVVVGYGQQKKASVVGAITQTSGATLQRAAGVTNVGAALTGNLPGVITTQDTGQPGEEDAKIVIRGTSSWNSSEPLVLVDGIERSMSSVDISSVANISVLKDASATAVFGVRGANGVILITTKRGEEGHMRIDAGFTTTVKRPSKLPNKYDSYDALMARNQTVELELPVTPTESWEYIRPQSEIEKYRDPNGTTLNEKGEELLNKERYPNIDWQDALFKDQAISYNGNISISGGSKFVRFYASGDYVYESDLMRIWDNGRGYKSGYNYQRINARSNLDFTITPTTTFRVNLYGSLGIKKHPRANSGDTWQEGQRWAGAYNIAPDVFVPKYDDNSWGYYPEVSNVTNSAQNLAISGVAKTTTNTITADFILEQNLDFITKGLSFRGNVSLDNSFSETGRGIGDDFNDTQQKWIKPETGQVFIRKEIDQQSGLDWVEPINWSSQAGSIDNNQTFRKMYYQLQLDWTRDFDLHKLTAMAMFSRNQEARGSGIPSYREDWAARLTYGWNNRYLLDVNGSYNGSEKFSSDYRFAAFGSGALGWTVSEEEFFSFLKDNHYVDMLKFRASLGVTGSDFVNPQLGSFLYMDDWAVGGTTKMALSGNETSAFEHYRMTKLGNWDLHWETVRKFNFGIDYSFLQGLLAGSVEIFRDKRYDILIAGGDRSTPSYFGVDVPVANLGETKARGYEVEVRLSKQINRETRVWGNFSLTHNENEVIEKDDPDLAPNYQKQEGYAIGQYRSFIDKGFINNIDELYGSPALATDDRFRLPGSYYIVDFNGDGLVDSKDQAPYGFTSTPQNTYNATLGFDWKGFSCFAQFYGVRNVTRDVVLQSFGQKLNTVYNMGDIWTKDNPNADVTQYRWSTAPVSKEGGSFPAYGTQYLFDGSYIRLKNVELAYTWHDGWIKNIGLSYLKLFVNGNNLWLWTRMPDDREANLGGGGFLGAYPTVKRFNLGLKLTL